MTESCGRSFDEALLSGYLDAALTQGDEQRVRVHLETCATCRGVVDEMRMLREVTMGSTFKTPVDDQWSEAPRTGASGLAVRLGAAILVVWVVGLTGFVAWQAATSDGPLLGKVIGFGGWSGAGLLLLAVLLDRLKARRTDRYREVRK